MDSGGSCSSGGSVGGGGGGSGGSGDGGGGVKEQEGTSVHSSVDAQPSSVSSLSKGPDDKFKPKFQEALKIYPLPKLQGVHRHFVLYGLTEYMHRSFDENFPDEEVLQYLNRVYNLETLKPDDEEAQLFKQQEDFYMPDSVFI